MKYRKKILAAVLCIGLLTPFSVSSAHGHQGGHHNNTNSSKYHYNCGGHRYPAHLHEDGACPYASSKGRHHNNTNSSKYHYNCGGHRYPAHLHKDGACPYASKKCPTCYRTSTIKKVQKKLNKLGYRCSKTGKYDTKTKSAICKYQKKKCIAVNGKINETLLKKMNIAHK